MKFNYQLRATILVCAATFGASALLVACGGGGSAAAGATVIPTTPTTVSVIDGPIQGAEVFLDKNGNGVWDTGEVKGTTDATGKVVLDVPTADVGKYPIVAIVGAGSIDADTGVAHTDAEKYVLKAPADATGVISPLTTMVQHAIESDTTKSTTTASAAAQVAADTGIANPMVNFVAPATADPLARSVAKAVVKITQAKSEELKTVVSTTDPVNNKPISKADIDALIRAEIIKLLPAIVTAVQTQTGTGGACATGMSTACQTAIATAVGAPTSGTSAATGLIAQTTTTATNAAVNVGVTNASKTPDAASTSTTPAAAGVNLDDFRFADVNNWSYRTFYASATENNTVDSNGMTVNHEGRAKSVAGTRTDWTYHGDSNRNGDLHYDGSAWTTCATSGGKSAKNSDSAGKFSYVYCGGMSAGSFTRTTLEIAGKTVEDVVKQIKTINSAWGDSPSSSLTQVIPSGTGTSVFPTGSTLRFQSTVPTASAFAYDSRPAVGTTGNGQVLLSPATVAAGGDATTGTPACSVSASRTVAPATTLASLIAQTPGTPCVFGAFTGTGAGGVALSSGTGTHSNWSWTTLNIGTIGSAPTVATANLAASYFTSNTYIRVGFPVGSGQVANYYSCKQNYAGGSENCTQIGAGTYTTTTVSDANVLSLQGVPEQPTSGLTYNRVFVERGGQIFYGYKNKLSNSQAARLNLTATNFVFGLLGIPAIPTP